MRPPVLVNLDVGELCSSVGGDPWSLDDELQAGEPGVIDDLADAYHGAGMCVTETEDDFVAAKKRFRAAYRLDHTEHPINASAEVTATTERLHLDRTQLAQIAAGLETIAAALAEAQRAGDADLAQTNTALDALDDQIGVARANRQDTSALQAAAVETVRTALSQVGAVRNGYIATLQSAEKAMAAAGYRPDAIDGVDGVISDPSTAAAEKYDREQRAADQATVAAGQGTEDARSAAARLRDSDTVHDPAAGPEARRLAGERLDDYNNSMLVGPLPTDTVLGGDARSRAQARLELQKQLEAAELSPRKPPLTPDQATALLDRYEAQARGQVLTQFRDQLKRAGVSDSAINAVKREIENGASPAEALKNAASQAGTGAGAVGAGLETYGRALPTGQHWGDVTTWAKADAEALTKLGAQFGRASTALDVALTGVDVLKGSAPIEAGAKLAGRVAGATSFGWLTGLAYSLVGGPEGAAFYVGATGAIAGAKAGEKLVELMIGK